ncbi:MAG TPA: cytochrome c oxidase subunit 3 [Bryobacteraceae bacterium]|nr:cytochrome c oxidase subunit 3 [Bryobacteraceae bacterium]
MSTSAATLPLSGTQNEARNLDRGKVGLVCLLLTETALFSIFVTAYLFFIGKSSTGPQPADVLTLPVWATACLLSSSLTVELAVRGLKAGAMGRFQLWLGVTVLLGAEFLRQTGIEWNKLINKDGLTIATNVFGTTYYSLVGLHASHVIIGLTLLLLVFLLSLRVPSLQKFEHRIELLGWYWHFVDVVWVVVFTVVYVIGR